MSNIERMLSRRDALRLLGIGAGAVVGGSVLGASVLGRAAQALIGPSDIASFPGQAGAINAYTTARGTAGWQFYAYAGTPKDDYHYVNCIVPQDVQRDVPTPIVFVIHGATNSEDCILGPISTTTGARRGVPAMADSWLDLGWIVIATREGGTPTTAGHTKNAKWGNESSRRAMIDAWRWASSIFIPAQDAGGNPLGFLLYGFSMGGGAGLNVAMEAQQQGVPIAALASVDGATNWAYLYTHSTAFAAQMRRAYGIVSPCTPTDAQWNAKINVADGGHDPQAVDPTAFPPIPMRFAASSSDGVVNRANNTLLFYNKMVAANWPAELGMVTYKGAHCAVSHFQPADTNAFFRRALGRPSTVTTTSSSTSTSTSTTESSTTTTVPDTTTTVPETTTTVPETTTSVPDTTTSVPDTTTTVDTTPSP